MLFMFAMTSPGIAFTIQARLVAVGCKAGNKNRRGFCRQLAARHIGARAACNRFGGPLIHS
jgi:hypothetical protein